MKNILKLSTRPATLLALSAAGLLAVGCGGNARTPDQWSEDTQQLMEAQKELLTTCYNRELASNNKLEGTVTVKFVVDNGTGRVRKVKVDPAGTTAGEPVRKCVAETLKDLRLTPPDANTGKATFTFEFKAIVPPPEAAPSAETAAPAS